MHLRRALMLFAVVLAAAAVVILLTPRRHESTVQSPVPALGAPAAGPATSTIRVAYLLRAAPRTFRLTSGEHLVLEVDTSAPGEATALGSTQSAEPLTPARFDFLAPGPGRYAVTFQPTTGAAQRLATLAVTR
jgi:hypothetical protein